MAATKNLSDNQLVFQLKTRNHDAFTEIYTRYWPVLFRHARKMLHDEDEAMDIVQDIFTHLWEHADTLDISGNLASYLYTAVRNKTINAINKGKHREEYLRSLEDFLEKGEFTTDDTVRLREYSQVIEQEIALLPSRMQQAFVLSRLSGYSYRQIAEEMNTSEETVRKQISRALKALRTRLGLPILALLVHLLGH